MLWIFDWLLFANQKSQAGVDKPFRPVYSDGSCLGLQIYFYTFTCKKCSNLSLVSMGDADENLRGKRGFSLINNWHSMTNVVPTQNLNQIRNIQFCTIVYKPMYFFEYIIWKFKCKSSFFKSQKSLETLLGMWQQAMGLTNISFLPRIDNLQTDPLGTRAFVLPLLCDSLHDRLTCTWSAFSFTGIPPS